MEPSTSVDHFAVVLKADIRLPAVFEGSKRGVWMWLTRRLLRGGYGEDYLVYSQNEGTYVTPEEFVKWWQLQENVVGQGYCPKVYCVVHSCGPLSRDSDTWICPRCDIENANKTSMNAAQGETSVDNQYQLVDTDYMMNPETDDLLFDGCMLKNGMNVLIEAPHMRAAVRSGYTVESEKRLAVERNRWAIVSELRVVGDQVAFIATYADGVKLKRTHSINEAWLVKIDSVPEAALEATRKIVDLFIEGE